ncbi:hypothetical protein [Photobacterium galatheae]|uniref:Uncharacterized protein n=1 Tax=Photobacterium galatheae TaxID=1654360 RepID=A0A066RS60_9GAMM|nr:hypothetical protein [Photobacterium galatheae]KDM90218.1 hypothetical protein EA58_18060 [Photobacterium galatheae]MCM0151519.1 hypothetical protein [Photobacterium galatheae]
MSSFTKYCKIDGLELSAESVRDIPLINDKLELGDILTTMVVVFPFVEIFSQKMKPQKRIDTINDYDWDTFAKSLLAVPTITRTRINMIAESRTFESNGKERQFWSCVEKASR